MWIAREIEGEKELVVEENLCLSEGERRKRIRERLSHSGKCLALRKILQCREEILVDFYKLEGDDTSWNERLFGSLCPEKPAFWRL